MKTFPKGHSFPPPNPRDVWSLTPYNLFVALLKDFEKLIKIYSNIHYLVDHIMKIRP